jgi:hypothetical protein
MRSGMVWLLASAAAICTAMSCSDNDDGAEDVTLPNQPGAGAAAGSGGGGGTGPASPAPAPAAAGAGGGSAVTPQVPRSDGGAAATDTTDAGAEQADPDAGPAAPVADAAPPPVTPPPVTPPPADAVGFSDVFPILVASCGNCHGANAPGNRPRFAQAGNEAASLTASLATAPQGGTVADRIIVRGVTQRNMPPACGGGALGTGACLDVAEAALLQAWVDQGSQP